MASIPQFSIIVPVFNGAAKLKECLVSIGAQTIRDFEIIVIDDASTENIEAVAAGYPAVHFIRHPINRGPAAARNTAIGVAHGEYVAFLDSDDTWFPWTLATYQKVIRQSHGPNFIAGREAHPAERTLSAPPELTIREYADYYSTAETGIWIPTCGVAIKREVVRDVGGFDESLRNAEDSDLWLRLGVAPQFVHVLQPPLFHYRRSPTGLTHDRKESLRGVSSLLESEKNNSYPGGSARREERQQIIGRHVRPYVAGALHRGEVRQAWRAYKAIVAWPTERRRLRFVLGFWLLLPLALVKAVTRTRDSQ